MFKNLNCEILETNPSVIRMHKKFLFKESKEKSKFVRNYDKSSHMTLTAERWMSKIGVIRSKYGSVFKKFN